MAKAPTVLLPAGFGGKPTFTLLWRPSRGELVLARLPAFTTKEMEPRTGVEPVTSSLPRTCSGSELYRRHNQDLKIRKPLGLLPQGLSNLCSPRANPGEHFTISYLSISNVTAYRVKRISFRKGLGNGTKL